MSKIDELTLREIREIRALFPTDAPLPVPLTPSAVVPGPYRVGDAVFVRTVTMHYTGRIVAIYPARSSSRTLRGSQIRAASPSPSRRARCPRSSPTPASASFRVGPSWT